MPVPFVNLSELPTASPLTGAEAVPVVPLGRRGT